MSSTDKLSAAVPTTETTIYSASDLDHDGILAVANNVTLALESEALFINDPTIKKNVRYCGLVTVASTASQTIPFYNILSAQIAGEALILKYAKAVVKDEYIPSTLTYTFDNQSSIAKAESWVKRLLGAAYGEAQQNKRLLVLINPQGGKGYAKELYNDYAAPMFEAAGCKVDVDITKYSGHATDIAEQLNIDEYDAILCCSGDGLPYEVLNGFAKRPNATEALAKVAVAMIPCGSGNAMAWNMFGTNSISLSALGVIKGLRLPLDLVSITQTGTRTLSFLSQSYGIIAESDLGTVHLRWMGAARFTFGFLTRLLRQTAYPCDIAFKLETADKQVMKERYLEYKKIKPTLRPVGGGGGGSGVGDEIIGKGLPDLKYGTVDDELPSDWEQVSTDTLSNFYAGNMAIMSADVNFFPATVPNDGLIDVVTIDGALGRLRALSMMAAVENGELFEFPEVEVRKVHGYRLTPRAGKDGYISVDGESIPFQPFQVEVHPGLGTTLSKSGHLYEARGPI